MYLPKHFAETDTDRLCALMRDRPLATLITPSADGIEANHLPLLLDVDMRGRPRLRGHLARANPAWRHCPPGTEALAIFHGPEGYVTPNWYPGKREHGKAVPTWNYAVVHARGALRVIDDAGWLRAQIADLTEHHEAGFAEPWSVDDAPPDYIEKLLAAIVGIEIVVTRLEGKWKASQNQPAENRRGVVAGLARQGKRELAALVPEDPA